VLRASDSPDQQDAGNQLQQAVAKTNIFALSSFTLKASVQVDVHGKLIAGTYQLLWNGPQPWREVASFPGYPEIQTGNKGQIWVQRNTDFFPVAIFNLHRALGFGSSAGTPLPVSLVRVDFAPKDRVTKVRKRKDHSEKLTGFEIERDGQSSTSEMCVRDETATLVPDGGPKAPGDLQPVGEKVFPRILASAIDGKTLANVDIGELTAGPQLAPATFAPIAGVVPQEGCMNPLPARLTSKQAPQYPEKAQSQRIQGTTPAQVTIGVDGVPKIKKVVESVDQDLEASSVAAISKWRYESRVV